MAFYGTGSRTGFHDHVAAAQTSGRTTPWSYMDLNRVGIYGGSKGGYNTVRAMLLASDVYHVGVAASHTNGPRPRLSPGRVYLGPPQHSQEEYEYADNLRFVDNLKGKLLLIHGTSDVASRSRFHGTHRSW